MTSSFQKAFVAGPSLVKSLGYSGGLKIIAIGPMGGKIVGYSKGKPVYAGSPAAAKLAEKLFSSDKVHKFVDDALEWFGDLGIKAKKAAGFPPSFSMSIDDAKMLHEAFPELAFNPSTQPMPKVKSISADQLKNVVGKPLQPHPAKASTWAAAAAAGVYGDDAPFSPDTLASLKLKGALGGSHGGQIVVDDKGKQYAWKTNHNQVWVSAAEEAFNRVAKLVFPKSALYPDAELVEHGGAKGVLLSWQDNSGTLGTESGGHSVPQKAMQKHFLRLVQHQVLDWMMSNHDSHGANFLLTPDGDVAAIDKGQAFKAIGSDKLSSSYKLNASAPVYNQMWSQLADGTLKVSHDDIISAVNDVLTKVGTLSEEQYKLIVTPYLQAAADGLGLNAETKWAAIAKRFHSLQGDFEGFLSGQLGKPVKLMQGAPAAPVEVVAQTAAASLTPAPAAPAAPVVAAWTGWPPASFVDDLDNGDLDIPSVAGHLMAAPKGMIVSLEYPGGGGVKYTKTPGNVWAPDDGTDMMSSYQLGEELANVNGNGVTFDALQAEAFEAPETIVAVDNATGKITWSTDVAPTTVPATAVSGKVSQIPGWPKTKGNVTVKHPGTPPAASTKWAAKFPGPGFNATINYKGKNYDWTFHEKGGVMSIDVLLPTGEVHAVSSPQKAADLMMLHETGNPLTFNSYDIKTKGLPSYAATKLLKLGDWQEDFANAVSTPQALDDVKHPASETVAQLEADKIVTPETPALSFYDIVDAIPDGVVNDLASLPFSAQQLLATTHKTAVKWKTGLYLHNGVEWSYVQSMGGTAPAGILAQTVLDGMLVASLANAALAPLPKVTMTQATVLAPGGSLVVEEDGGLETYTKTEAGTFVTADGDASTAAGMSGKKLVAEKAAPTATVMPLWGVKKPLTDVVANALPVGTVVTTMIAKVSKGADGLWHPVDSDASPMTFNDIDQWQKDVGMTAVVKHAPGMAGWGGWLVPTPAQILALPVGSTVMSAGINKVIATKLPDGSWSAVLPAGVSIQITGIPEGAVPLEAPTDAPVSTPAPVVGDASPAVAPPIADVLAAVGPSAPIPDTTLNKTTTVAVAAGTFVSSKATKEKYGLSYASLGGAANGGIYLSVTAKSGTDPVAALKSLMTDMNLPADLVVKQATKSLPKFDSKGVKAYAVLKPAAEQHTVEKAVVTVSEAVQEPPKTVEVSWPVDIDADATFTPPAASTWPTPGETLAFASGDDAAQASVLKFAPIGALLHIGPKNGDVNNVKPTTFEKTEEGWSIVGAVGEAKGVTPNLDYLLSIPALVLQPGVAGSSNPFAPAPVAGYTAIPSTENDDVVAPWGLDQITSMFAMEQKAKAAKLEAAPVGTAFKIKDAGIYNGVTMTKTPDGWSAKTSKADSSPSLVSVTFLSKLLGMNGMTAEAADNEASSTWSIADIEKFKDDHADMSAHLTSAPAGTKLKLTGSSSLNGTVVEKQPDGKWSGTDPSGTALTTTMTSTFLSAAFMQANVNVTDVNAPKQDAWLASELNNYKDDPDSAADHLAAAPVGAQVVLQVPSTLLDGTVVTKLAEGKWLASGPNVKPGQQPYNTSFLVTMLMQEDTSAADVAAAATATSALPTNAGKAAQLEVLPVGTGLSMQDAGAVGGAQYVKTADGLWKLLGHVYEGAFKPTSKTQAHSSAGTALSGSYADDPKENYLVTPPGQAMPVSGHIAGAVVVPKIPTHAGTLEQLEALPVGSGLTMQSYGALGGGQYVKLATGQWQKIGIVSGDTFLPKQGEVSLHESQPLSLSAMFADDPKENYAVTPPGQAMPVSGHVASAAEAAETAAKNPASMTTPQAVAAVKAKAMGKLMKSWTKAKLKAALLDLPEGFSIAFADGTKVVLQQEPSKKDPSKTMLVWKPYDAAGVPSANGWYASGAAAAQVLNLVKLKGGGTIMSVVVVPVPATQAAQPAVPTNYVFAPEKLSGKNVDGIISPTVANLDAAHVGAQVVLPSGILVTKQADGTWAFPPNGPAYSSAKVVGTSAGISWNATLLITMTPEQAAAKAEATAMLAAALEKKKAAAAAAKKIADAKAAEAKAKIDTFKKWNTAHTNATPLTMAIIAHAQAKFSAAAKSKGLHVFQTDVDTLIGAGDAAAFDALKKSVDNWTGFPPYTVVSTPVGDMISVSSGKLAAAVPEAASITGPDGQSYPHGTTFEQVEVPTKTKQQALMSAATVHKIIPHQSDPTLSAIKVQTDVDAFPDKLAALGIALAPTSDAVPSNPVKGASTVFFVAKADLAATAEKKTETVATKPTPPESVKKAVLPFAQGTPPQGSPGVRNQSDLSSLSSLVPSKNGHSIRIGKYGALRDSQLRVKRVKREDGSIFYELHGQLNGYNPSKSKGMSSGSFSYDVTSIEESNWSAYKYDPETGTHGQGTSSKSWSGYSGKTANGSTVAVVGEGPPWALANKFVVRIEDGADAHAELAAAFTMLGKDPDLALGDHDDEAEKNFIKAQLVRSGLGVKGFFDKDAFGESLQTWDYEDPVWLDKQLAKLGMAHLVDTATIETGIGGQQHVIVNDPKESLKDVQFITSGVSQASITAMLTGGGMVCRTGGYMAGTNLGGASATSDEGSGGASGTPTRIHSSWMGDTSYSGVGAGAPLRVVVHPRALKRSDWWLNDGDCYMANTAKAHKNGPAHHWTGDTRKKAFTKDALSEHGGNELCFEHGIALTDFAGIAAESEHYKTALISSIKARDPSITHINGIPLDEFIFVESNMSAKGIVAKAPGLKDGVL